THAQGRACHQHEHAEGTWPRGACNGRRPPRRGDRMRRREFIPLLGGAAATWPLAARAQGPFMPRAQASRPVIGYLAVAASASVLRSATALALIRGLRDQGYSEGRDIDIFYR